MKIEIAFKNTMKYGPFNENFPQCRKLSLGSIFRKKIILCYLEYGYDDNICTKIGSTYQHALKSLLKIYTFYFFVYIYICTF